MIVLNIFCNLIKNFWITGSRHELYFEKKQKGFKKKKQFKQLSVVNAKKKQLGKILNAAERMRVRGQARARGQALALAWSYFYVYNKANCTTCSLLCSTR